MQLVDGDHGRQQAAVSLSVVYPLPSEDELAPLRSTVSLLGGFSPQIAKPSSGADSPVASDSEAEAAEGRAAPWAVLCSAVGGTVLQFDADDAGAWRRTHLVLKLEDSGVAIGQAVVSLGAVAASSGGSLALSVAVRRQSVKQAILTGTAVLADAPLGSRYS